jgi:hypothetical protein
VLNYSLFSLFLNNGANKEESTVIFFGIIVSGHPFVSPTHNRPSRLGDNTAHEEITADWNYGNGSHEQ